jgi:hypothetical protein
MFSTIRPILAKSTMMDLRYQVARETENSKVDLSIQLLISPGMKNM